MGTVLLILKIIGIILLGLLGFILIAALLLVFYPVSYKLLASYEETVAVKLKVHWLFHLISVTLDYEREKKKCIFRLCGIPLMDFLNPKPRKEKKKKATKKKKRKSVSPDHMDKTDQTAKEEKKSFETASSVERRQASMEEDIANTGAEETEGKNWIKTFWDKITGFLKRIKTVIADIIQKIRDIYEKGVNLKEKLDKWIEVLERERTRQALDKVKHHIIGLLKHVLPRKWKAFLLLGFDDPAVTGRIMGYYWMFIGLWGEHFICTPDFEHKVLKGNIEAKGHIQGYKFLYVAYKFMFDKDLIYLRKIKEEVNS